MAFTILLKTKDAFEDVKPVNLTGVISLMKETFCWFVKGRINKHKLNILPKWHDKRKASLSSNWTGAPYYNLISEIHGGNKIWGSFEQGEGCANWNLQSIPCDIWSTLSFILLIVFCSWNFNFLQILFSGIFVYSFCSSAVISRRFSWKTMKISATEYSNQLSRVQNSELRHLPYMVPKKARCGLNDG